MALTLLSVKVRLKLTADLVTTVTAFLLQQALPLLWSYVQYRRCGEMRVSR